MANLRLYKVNSLPATLQPSAMYFVKSGTSTFSIYLTDKLGNVSYRSPDSSDISSIVLAIINSLKGQPGGLASLDLDGNLIQTALSAASIDGQNGDFRSNGNFVWGSVDEILTTYGTGTNDPTRITLFNGLQGLRFRSDRLIQTWVDFLIPYDVEPGTSVYPVINWMPTTNNSGVCRWGIEYSVAKGFAQQTFPSTITEFINETIASNSRWQNRTTEFLAISGINIEPGSVVKMRVFRDGANAADTYNSDTTAWKASLRYQRARIGTRNRIPNFYT